jgi:hypothetical protein
LLEEAKALLSNEVRGESLEVTFPMRTEGLLLFADKQRFQYTSGCGNVAVGNQQATMALQPQPILST